jgi:predicted RNA-binding protein with TRAM domain
MRNDRGGRRDFDSRSFVAPVKVGDELDVKVEAVGEKGDGIAKKDGFVLFVPGTKEGDNVRIKITRVLPKVGFAEVVGQASGEESSESSGDEESGAGNDLGSQESSSGDEYSGEDSDNFGEEDKQ